MTRREKQASYKPVHGLGAWIQLIRAYNHVESEVSTDLRADDLSLARLHVMVALDLYGPMSQQALADHLFVTKGNIVGLINKLAARGLVERNVSQTDRRSNLLSITTEGQEVIDRIMPRQRALVGELMSPLSEHECGLLEKMLTRLHQAQLEIVAGVRQSS